MAKRRMGKGSNNLSRMSVADRNSLYRGKACTFTEDGKTVMVGIVKKFLDDDRVEVMRKQCSITLPIKNVKF